MDSRLRFGLDFHLKTPIPIHWHFPKEIQTGFRLQKATETGIQRPKSTGSLKRSVIETQIRWQIPTEILTHSARVKDSRMVIEKMMHLVIPIMIPIMIPMLIHLDSPMLMDLKMVIQKRTLKLIRTSSHLDSPTVIHWVIHWVSRRPSGKTY